MLQVELYNIGALKIRTGFWATLNVLWNPESNIDKSSNQTIANLG